MDAMMQWLVQDEGVNYLVVFEGLSANGQASVSINGVVDTYVLTQIEDRGLFTPLLCGQKECYLQVDEDKAATLYVDGQVHDPIEPDEPSASVRTAAPAVPLHADLQKKIKSGMSSFMTLIILSLINNILAIVNASISFPFSIFSSVAVMGLTEGIADNFGIPAIAIVGLVLSFLTIGIYALLYYLSARRVWPVWTAFGLFVADTLLLAGFALLSDDLSSFTFDFVFHVYIIWALLTLARSKMRLSQLTRSYVDQVPEGAHTSAEGVKVENEPLPS
jgi:hypothetical protein